MKKTKIKPEDLGEQKIVQSNVKTFEILLLDRGSFFVALETVCYTRNLLCSLRLPDTADEKKKKKKKTRKKKTKTKTKNKSQLTENPFFCFVVR